MGRVFLSGGKGGMNNASSRLPSGYTELVYIQSSGTQYIDTEITDCIKLVADIQFINTGSRALMGYGTASGQYFGISAKGYLELGSTNVSTVSGLERNIVTFELADGATTLTANGVTISRARSKDPSANFCLFGNLTSYPCSAKIFSCQIYTNGALIRDFAPCVDPNGNIGLYDIVNSKFYGNAGSGSFVGSEVE